MALKLFGARAVDSMRMEKGVSALESRPDYRFRPVRDGPFAVREAGQAGLSSARRLSWNGRLLDRNASWSR